MPTTPNNESRRMPRKRRRGEKLPRLTDRQRRFVEEFMIDFCATRAAIRAGYSSRNAGKIGPRLRRKPQVAAAIETILAEESRLRRLQEDARRAQDRLQIWDSLFRRESGREQ